VTASKRARPSALGPILKLGLTIAAAAAMSGACSSATLPARPGNGNSPEGGTCIDNGVGCAKACSSGEEDCPCSSNGLKVQCGVELGKVGNELSCAEGQATCENGKWSACDTSATSGAEAYRAPLHAQGLGSGTACTQNPCDPFCEHFPDTPDPTLSNDAGVVGTDAGLTLPAYNPNFDGGSVGLACGTETQKATLLPLDLYLMIDKSGSMADNNKWNNVSTALEDFVNDPASAGIGVGLQYLPFETCTTTCFFGWFCVTSCGNVSCNASDYATPAVGIAPLPGNANPIINSLSANGPGGGTPTEPAVEGAIDYAKSWKTAHPTHVVAVVLATDGEPDGCNSTVNNSATAAANGFNGTPSIPTYVIGVGGSLTSLNTIASHGGTNQAFIVDDSTYTESQFAAALLAIRSTSAGCSYTLPQPTNGKLDPTSLRIQYTSGGTGNPVTLNKVSGKNACTGSGGWYFDNPSNPSEMELCPASCTTVQGNPAGQVQVVYSCLKQFQPGVFTRDYDAGSVCPAGTEPAWGAWSWSSTTPGNSSINFKVAVADTAAGLSSAPLDAMQFTNPPGPSGLAGQAIGANTANGADSGTAVVEKTLIANSRKKNSQFLRVQITLQPSTDKTQAPTLNSWDLQVSCQPAT
jgi:hypothetical protein